MSEPNLTNPTPVPGVNPPPVKQELKMEDLPPEEQAELLEMVMEALGLTDDEKTNPSASKQKDIANKAKELLKNLASAAALSGFSIASMKADPSLAASIFDQYQSDSLATSRRQQGGGYNARGAQPGLTYEIEERLAAGTDAINLGLTLPMMIVLMTDLLQEVARVLRQVMEGEASLRGQLVELINESGQAAAEATYNGAMEEAQKTRDEAVKHFANAIIAVVTAAATVGAHVGTSRYSRKSSAGKKLTAQKQQKKQLDADLKQAKANQSASGANTPQAQKANQAEVDNIKAQQKQNQQDIDATTNRVSQEKSAMRQTSGQVVQQLGSAASSINEGIGKLIEAAHIEAKAQMDMLAAIFNLMTQMIEKMYSGSLDSSQKAWSLMETVNRALEEIKQITGKIGWGQP